MLSGQKGFSEVNEPSFARKLNRWYRREARDLPWRRTSDPYKIWISEVMLQQTTVNACIPYYRRWIREFPTPKHVARAPLQKILRAWQGLGYYQRARNIHASAKIIQEKHKGKIPPTPELLKKLPGFGPYTVGAILSIAFDRRYSIIDANVRRVFMRILAIHGHATPSQDPPILKFLEVVLPKKNIKIFNQALMELGALICRNRTPVCSLCPVKEFCKAYRKGVQEIIPTPKKTLYNELNVVLGVMERNKRYFIQQRPSGGLLADLWEFPGGKIKSGESKGGALARELKEECGVEIASHRSFMRTTHFYTNNRVQLHVFFCKPKVYPLKDARHHWVTLKEIERYPMPSGSAKIIDKLKELHSGGQQ